MIGYASARGIHAILVGGFGGLVKSAMKTANPASAVNVTWETA